MVRMEAMAAAEVNGTAMENGKRASDALGVPRTKNAKRRQQRKDRKSAPSIAAVDNADQEVSQRLAPSTLDLDMSSIEDTKIVHEYTDVFKRFQGIAADEDEESLRDDTDMGKGQVIYSDDEQPSEGDIEAEEREQSLSKRRLKKMHRLTIAELKQMVAKPELVEWEDVTAPDPQLLLHIKSARNTVSVPPHWSLKREYLQNKKGIEKQPFQLPSYIAATGIAQVKDALKEKEQEQSLKTKTRERVQPKMGKIMIDYQKLYDAFFRFQHRPESLTKFGEVFYEGKEAEKKFAKNRTPGVLSVTLQEALSIPPGAPPPWLMAMQRFGPPPSYPHLRIPGLNAPIPEGASWGFNPGAWGQPPMDELGNPLFPGVLQADHLQNSDEAVKALLGEPQRERFGELEPEEEVEESDSDTSEDQESGQNEIQGQALQAVSGGMHDRRGLDIPQDMQDVAAAAAAKTIAATDNQGMESKQLYHVLPEHEIIGAQGFLASDHGYDLSVLRQAATAHSGNDNTTQSK